MQTRYKTLILDIAQTIFRIKRTKIEMKLLWIPAHIDEEMSWQMNMQKQQQEEKKEKISYLKI